MLVADNAKSTQADDRNDTGKSRVPRSEISNEESICTELCRDKVEPIELRSAGKVNNPRCEKLRDERIDPDVA